MKGLVWGASAHPSRARTGVPYRVLNVRKGTSKRGAGQEAPTLPFPKEVQGRAQMGSAWEPPMRGEHTQSCLSQKLAFISFYFSKEVKTCSTFQLFVIK